jgi:hypothetical protein
VVDRGDNWAKSCAGLRELRVSRRPGGRDEGALQDFGNWASKRTRANIDEGGRDKEKGCLLFLENIFREKNILEIAR